ncbi:POTRA domain-containing protein [Ottowia pentelensis]|uniref:POTRA domain-containing protein n=1 Tax=Ottowia pentelensis TaxID=511108 RepID=UPI00363F3420
MSIRPAPLSASAVVSARLVAALVTAFGLAQPALAQAPASQSLPSTAAPAETTFRLNDVRLKGVTAMDEQELHQLAAPYLGREVNLAELQALAQAITTQYREHGYFLAQAIIPVQQVKDGVVEISVIEGRLGQVNVTVAPDAPITAERVRAFLAAVPVGRPSMRLPTNAPCCCCPTSLASRSPRACSRA